MWTSDIQHNTSSTGIVRYWLCRLWLTLMGWKIIGELPQDRKFVLVGGPHTSNWDFFIGLPVLWVYRIKVMWMMKHTMFIGPLGWLLRSMGGIPIDRSAAHGIVDQMVERFMAEDAMVLVVPAKGTRSKTDYWKSGFYHIAQAAGVPVGCGYLDFSTRTACIGYRFIPSGDIRKDMDGVRSFLGDARGKHPELEDNIRLKEEG